MRLIFLFLICTSFTDIEAAYHIDPKASTIVVAGSEKSKSTQFEISLDSVSATSGEEVLTISTQKAKKQIPPAEAYKNFKRVGGLDENADISLTPILMKVKVDGKSMPVQGRVSFSRNDTVTGPWIYLSPTEKNVVVGFE